MGNPVTGLILAGGQSRRMGTDKAELMLQGHTLLSHAYCTLSSLSLAEILITYNNIITDTAIEHQDTRVITPQWIQDVIPHCGPLGGIYSALLQTPNDLLVIPVDMPQLSPDLLNQLIYWGQQTTLACFNHSPLPLYISNTPEIKNDLADCLTSQHNKSLKRLINTFPCIHIPTTEALLNINTPEQYQQLLHTLNENTPCQTSTTPAQHPSTLPYSPSPTHAPKKPTPPALTS